MSDFETDFAASRQPQVEQPKLQSFDEEFANFRQGVTAEEGKLRMSVDAASKTTPDRAAELKYLSNTTGLPKVVVETAEGEAKARAKFAELQEASRFSPVLRAKLLNPEFTALAQNDGVAMSGIEAKLRGFGQAIAGDLAGGSISGVGRGLEIAQRNGIEAFANLFLPTPQAGPTGVPAQKPTTASLVGPLVGADWRREGDAVQAVAEKYMGVPDAQKDFGYQVSRGLGQVAGQIGMALTGFGALSTGSMYAMGLDQMGQKVDNDPSSQGAKDLATVLGAVWTGATEKYSLDLLLGKMALPIKNAMMASAARIGMSAAAEGTQEWLENVGQDMLRQSLTNPDAKIDWGGANDAGGVGATVGGIVKTLVESALHIKNRGHQAEVERTQRELGVVQSIFQEAAGTDLHKLDKATLGEFVQAAADDAKDAPKSLWIDPQVLAETLQQQGVTTAELAKQLPSVDAQLADALVSRTRVELPIGELTAAISGTPLEQALLPHLSTTADGLSLTEATQRQEHAQDMLSQQADRVIAQAADSVKMAASAELVRNEIKAQLDAAGRFSSDVNAKGAALMQQFYTVMAGHMGVTPEELYRHELPHLVKGAFNGQPTLDQNSPKFQQWFRNSQIVDANGKPRVMYHGTARDISAFKAKQAGAIFVTDDPSFAEDFTEMSKEWMVEHYEDELSPAQIDAAMAAAEKDLRGRYADNPDQADLAVHRLRMKQTGYAVVKSALNKALADQLPTGPNIMPLYVSAQNPFDYDNPEHVDAVVAELNKSTNSWGQPRGESAKGYLATGNWEEIEKPSTQVAIKAAGFDGFYVKEAKRKNLAVYEQTQLKSVFNGGQYSLTDGNVLNQSFEHQADTLAQSITDAGGNVVDLMQVDQLLDSKDIPTITVQDLVGKSIFPTIADRTAAAAVYDGIDSSKLDVAIPLLGGPFFPLRESNAQAGVVWANRGDGVIAQKAAKLKEGANYMLVVMGDANMHQSNSTVAAAFMGTLEAWVRDGRITATQLDALGTLVRETGAKGAYENAQKIVAADAALAAAVGDKAIDEAKKKRANLMKATSVFNYVENFPGFDDSSIMHTYMDGVSFDARKRILGIMASKQAMELGAPPMQKILDATREPSLAGHRWGDGVLLVEVDQTNPQVELGTEGTTHHPDFPVGVRGKIVGKLNAPLSHELLWQDWFAANADKASPRRAFELSKPIVTVTQELADRIGKITQTNIDGARQARLAADFAAGNWRTSDTPVNKGGISPQEFIDAIANSDAKETLTPYTLDEVKQGIKDKTMRLYQLGDGQIFFMLKTQEDGKALLASVVNNERGARGIGAPAVVLKAIEEGATDLDCYATKNNKFPKGFLPTLYASFGFVQTESYDFDAQYFKEGASEDVKRLALADAVKYWKDSTPGYDPQTDGMPPLVMMQWKGTDDERAKITERYLRGGIEGLLSGGASADVADFAAEFGLPNRQEAAGVGATPVGGRAAGTEGAGAGASIASRARGTVQAIAGLSRNELTNLGLTPEDRSAVRQALGYPEGSGTLAQSAVPNKYQEKYLAGRDVRALSPEEREQYDIIATPADTLEQPARGNYDIGSMTTVLNGTADLSTFLHESGHFFLDAIRRLATKPDAPESVRAMYARALKGLGVTEEQWNAWHTEYDNTGKISDGMRAAHERFAETFELYLFSGKAPTQELQSLFRTFAEWLKRVYTSMAQFATSKNITLDPDLKQVMDRMLATDAQITETEQVAGLLPDLDATAEAQEKFNARSMRDLKWAVNARNKVIKKLQQEAAAKRKEVEDEVRAEVNEMPVYKAMRFIKKGELVVDGEEIKATKGHKINTEALAAMYPDSALGNPDLTKLKGMTASTGLSPNELADALPGFTSGDQLVRSIVDAEPIESVIEGMTDQRMLERFGDLSTPEAIAQAATDAVHNEARAKSLATELAAQRELLNPRTDTGEVNAKGSRITVNALVEAAKSFAANVIGKRKLGDLKKAKWSHLQAERRAAKAWETATAKGDTQEAVQAKQDQMLNNYAVRAVADAQVQVRKAMELFKRVTKGTDENLVERGLDPDIANAARAILATYGIAPSKGKSAIEYLQTLEPNDPAMYGVVRGPVEAALANAKPFAELTVSELGALTDEIASLWHLARRSRQMEVDGDLLDRADVQDQLKERLVEIGIPDAMPGDKSAITPKEQALRKLSAFRALATRMENWTQHLGPVFTKFAFQPVKEAADRYRKDKGAYLNKFRTLLGGIEFKRGTIAAPELGYTFGEDTGGVAMSELMHAILHTGNASNKKKLLVGRGWATENADGTLDTSRWDAFMQRMIDEGVVGKQHFDFAQGVWDLMESMKPLAQKTHRDVFGRYFAEVTADAFTTPFGAYRGGYVPAIADSRIVDDAATRALAEAENDSMAYAFPTTNKGFTKGRVEYNRPLLLNVGTLTQHMDKVLKFSHLETPVRDVRKVLSAKGVAYGLNRIDPVAFDNIVTPWLNRAARQSVETPVAGDQGLSRLFSVARNRAGLGAMFANIANSVQQITGFSMAAIKVKPNYMIEAAASMVSDRKAMLKNVCDASIYMQERMENDVANAEAALRDILLDPTTYDKAKDWSQKHAYFLQQAVDNVMGPVIWTGAYNQAVAEGVSEKDAVRHADSVIRTTQGSTLPEDISRFEGGPAWARVFTQFTSYFNMQANLMGTEFANVARDIGVKKGAGKMLYVTLLGLLAPAWVGEAIMQAFRGGPDDEDKDGEYLDDWIAAVFGWSVLRNVTAMVPAVGPVVNATFNAFNKNPNDDRVGNAAAVSKIEAAAHAPSSVYKAIVEDGNQQKAVRDVSALITLTTGLPVDVLAKPLGYAAAVHQGKVAPTSAADAVRGAITGVASPESK